MNDVIARIKQSVKKHSYHIVHGINNHDEGMTVQGFYQVIDEELAKEPQEEINIPLECVDGSCPMALSDEYEERGMDVIHSCAECQYQPQVQPIVRTQADRIRSMSDEEMAELFTNVTDDIKSGSSWDYNGWIDWLLGKQEE